MNSLLTPKRITVNGLAFNVLVEGEGPDVLLVHGFPDSHDVWRKQIPALVAAGYRVIAPDTRGCGDSEIAPGVSDYGLGILVSDLAGILDALGIDKVRLVGHDWGAAIGWAFCMRHPQRVDRYAALSVGHLTAYARGSLVQKLKAWYVLMFQLPGLAEWVIRAWNWRFLRAFTGFAEEWPGWRRRAERPGRLTAGLNYYRANRSLVLGRRLPDVPVPVMGVFSTGDRFLDERQMMDSARYVRGPWRYERIEGVCHWLQLEAPERVNALLLDFFR
ncbi:MAG: alpha/beta fold hydrolase [Paucibacter sp.]|nr:alpha/beta fold hydrolase [Roseateles sp.]